MRRRTVVLAFVGALCIVGVVGWNYTTRPDADAAEIVPSPVPVVTAPVQVSDLPIVKVGLGTVTAYNTVDVHSQVTGTIQQIGFVEGQTVHPGSLIAQLDPRTYQAALQQAQAALARDQAHLQNARDNLSRYVPLLKQGFSTEQQVGDQTAAVGELQAAITSDEAAIANAQTQLGYTTITSPIDGVTGIRRVDIGNIVQPVTATPIVTITQVQPISVVFTLPQKDLPDVQAAMLTGPLQAIAYPQDGSTPLDKGSLLLINNQINAASGTVELKATFPNAKKTLWPGEFVEIRLVTSVRHDAVSVPLSALQQGDTGERVFVVNSDNRVTLRPVTIAQTLDGRALVDNGLKSGETIVVAGQYRLEGGTKIAAVAPNDPNVQNQTARTQGMLQ
jgi:multidrug efflux system membrane fusion protein